MGLPLPFYLLGRGRSRGLLMPILAGEERGSIRLLLPQPVGGIQQHNTANAHPLAGRVRQQKISNFFTCWGVKKHGTANAVTCVGEAEGED